tara:strand:+ start:364 stop:585 length:222 start_codon:yes stop_codon:yes gene_type:complete
MLRSIADRKPCKMTFDRAEAILKTFRYHGLVDANEELTTRGKHVASLLPQIVVEELPVEIPAELDPVDEKEWD